MGSSEYYTCSVKLASQGDALPDPTLKTSSSLPSLFKFKTLLSDGKSFEVPLIFQVKNITFTNGVSTISDININGVDFQVSKTSKWDSDSTGYYYSLFVELSMYNSTVNDILYDNRFVSLFLNMTQ